MSVSNLSALRTMVRIRLRRQGVLDALIIQEQSELKRLADAVNDASSALHLGKEKVEQQASKIEGLTAAGARIQIAQYLAEQDFLSGLSDQADVLQSRFANAESSVMKQTDVVKKARLAASNNEAQRERLSENIRTILAKADLEQMDRQDEEAEEANIVLTRRRLQMACETGLGFDHA